MFNKSLLSLFVFCILVSWSYAPAQQQKSNGTRTISYKDLGAMAKKPGSGVKEVTKLKAPAGQVNTTDKKWIKVKVIDLPYTMVDGKKTIKYGDLTAFAVKSKQITPHQTVCHGPQEICCPCGNDPLCIVEVPDECTTTCSVDEIIIDCPNCPSYVVQCQVQ